MGCGRPAPFAPHCGECIAQLRRTLDLAATIEPDLLDAVAKQLKRGPGGGSASTEAPLPYDPAASDARRALSLELARAVYEVIGAEHWPIADTSITGMATWLADHMSDVIRHPAAAQIHMEIRDAVDNAVDVLDGPPELKPAGDCPECTAPLLAEPRADEATCRKCGTVTTGIATARAARAAAADVLGNSEDISNALAGIGIRVAAGTIRKWVERKRLTMRPGGAIAMSDVLGLVAERDRRKANA